MRLLSGPVLADLAANVLAMTLVVLIVLARVTSQPPPSPPPEPLAVMPVLPMGGAAAVEVLRQRLLPGTVGFVDLGPAAPDDPATVSVLLILDPTHYAKTTSTLAARGQTWRELTIPEALKNGVGQWHPEFLALATFAADPDRFQIALQALLARRMGVDNATGAFGQDGSSPTLRFPRWFQAALDILGLSALCAGFWVLFRLRRWAVKA